MTVFYKNKPSDIKNYSPTSVDKLNMSGAALVFLLLMGCSDNSQYESSSPNVDFEESMQAAEEVSSAQGVRSVEDEDNAEQNHTLTVENIGSDSAQSLDNQVTGIEIAGKTLLININADFKVADVVKSSSAIEKLTQQQGGYVALSTITNNETDRRTFSKGAQNITLVNYQRQANMTVRVPKVNVKAFLQQLQSQVAFLNNQSFSAQDVTLDIYREQLASKLNNDMATELERERLKNKTDKTQNSNIDAITATYAARQQQQYAKLEQMDIADKVKYSSLFLSFNQPISSYQEITQNIDLLIAAQEPSFSEQVVEALKVGWDTLKAVIIKLLGLWWFVVMIVLFYLLYRLIKLAYRQLVPFQSKQNNKQYPTSKSSLSSRNIENNDAKK